MKRNHIVYLTVLAAFVLGNCSFYQEKSEASSVASSPIFSANDVWSILNEQPYEKENLPTTEVTLASFLSSGVDLLLASAKRTLESEADILPHFDKLLHPNGVCLKGIWTIDAQSSYSGYFKQGSQGIIIARASTTLSNTKRGSLRGFGFAGKIFPTLDGDNQQKTANFFLIDNLGGTYADNYTEVGLTNEPNVIPTLSFEALSLIQIAQAAQKAFSSADVNPGIRQLYPISQLGLGGKKPITPKWMKIKGDIKELGSDEEDFRAELSDHLSKNDALTFGIFVADETDFWGSKKWMPLGNIVFSEAVVSEACDHQLHFHHNKFIANDI